LREAFSAANVPLKTLENVNLKEYLECNLKNVGIIPSLSHLRQFYLPRVFENHVTEMKEKLKTCNGMSIVTDETTDTEDRCVLNILGVLGEPECELELKLNVLFLDSVNFKSVSQAIWETLDKFEVPFDRITVVVDNAMYMKKVWEQNLKPLFLNAVHVTCNAHLLNLVDVIKLCQSPEVLEELNILQKYAPAIMHTLTKYEESVIRSHVVSNDIRDLIMWAKSSVDECEHAMGRDALLNSAEKIETYMQCNSNARFCQPAAAFFNACWVFDPKQAKYLIIPEKEVFEVIPLFEDNSVARHEYRAYLKTVYKMQCENVYQVWRTLKTRFPALAVIAIWYLTVPVNSVDAEKSLSAYKNVLWDDQRSIKASNLSMHSVLCQNKL
uniref:HAT C-terminal dimerisation domain-containing protein n=1 Tax=Latimeria chalumnae TaxID=7897 RepID=H3B835_LATCH